MEKEKTRGRTRRKQPSQVAGFLYREGRKWCAAALMYVDKIFEKRGKGRERMGNCEKS